MNSKAKELGCLNTHFVNANGINDENHYSTAYDLALMGRYAMKNESFREIVATTFYTLPATNKYPTNDRVFGTTNELMKKDTSDRVDNYYYEYCTGIKTGYTTPAKNCIVASAKKDNVEYIVVVLGAQATPNGLSARYLDCKNLFEFAFKNYTVKKMNDANSVLKNIKVSNATSETKNLNVVVQDEINILVNKDTNTSTLIPIVEIDNNIQAPVAKNTVIGKITYTVDGNEYSSNLLAGDTVKEFKPLNFFLTLISIFIVLLLLYKLLNLDNNKKKRNKKSKKKSNYLYW